MSDPYLEHDLGVMVDGFRALLWLGEHSEEVGLGGNCRACTAFAIRLSQGATPADVLHLRCQVAQAYQKQVDAAVAVIKLRYP